MSSALDGQTQGRVITFYSYKGGTGRSMALANVAYLLAQGSVGGGAPSDGPNRRVLAIDWDLEAPGLHRYFRPFLPGGQDAKDDAYDREHPGLIELFLELNKATGGRSSGGPHQDTQVAARILEALDIEHQFIVSTSVRHLSFMKAGRFDGSYPSRVSTFRWDLLYERTPSLIPTLAQYLSERFSYVLIDSRTGITDISGICTMVMPELLVLVFTPNRQSLTGVIDLTREATDYRRESADLRPLVVFPLPSRIEPARPKLLEYWRNGSKEMGFLGYQAEFETAFREAYKLERCDLTGYFDEVQIQHVPDYAYGEQIAADVEETDSRLSLKRSYEGFTRRLVGLASPWTDPRSAAAQVQILELCQRGAAALDSNDTQRARRHFDRAVDLYLESESFPIPELSDGLQRLGSQLLADGELGDAEAVLREAVKVTERSFGSEDLRVADTRESLGDALTAAGKAAEGLKVISDALELRRKALGPRHPCVADLYDKLGGLLAGMGRLEESRSYFVQSLEARRELFGPDHPAVAASLERLAETATAMGSLREAEEYLGQALQIGAHEGPTTKARILDRLGWLNLRKRQLDAAEQYFREAVDTGLAATGTEDSTTASTLDGLAQVAIARGDFEGAQSYYERAQLAREAALGASHPETLRSIVNLGDLAATQGKWERANTHYRRVVSLVEKTVGDTHPLAAEVYRKLGAAAEATGDYSTAVTFFERSIAISEQLGDRAGVAASYQQLGMVAYLRGDYDQALDRYRKSLTILEELGNRAGMAGSYHQLGMVAQDRGDYEQALDWYRQALTISEELGDRASMAASYHQLGTVAQDRGDYDQALDWHRRALTIDQELGDRAGMARSYHRLGMVAQARGDYDQALDWYRRALTINEELSDRAGMARSYHRLGMVAQARGDYDQALDWYRRALTINEELGDRAGMARSYHRLGMVAQARGDYDQALDWYRRALTINEELGNRPGIASTNSQIGALLIETGSQEDGLRWILRSLAIRVQLGLPIEPNLLQVLQRQQGLIGTEQFEQLLRQELGDQASQTVIGWLQQLPNIK
jgi:tetratricopeptide (TPR) repeat protein